MRLSMIVLLLAGLGFLGFGLWLLFDPVGGLARVGIAAARAEGVIELRAFYGGMEVGLGLFLIACALRADWQQAGLWLVLLANAGTGLARVAGMAGSGVSSSFLIGALVWEFGFALLAGVALARS